jgi:hypothetical protein
MCLIDPISCRVLAETCSLPECAAFHESLSAKLTYCGRANTTTVHRKGLGCLAPAAGDSVPVFIHQPRRAVAGTVSGCRLCGGFCTKAERF